MTFIKTLSKCEYEELIEGADILEQDRHGVKVLRLKDGLFLKTFWYRRRFSSRRLYPEWLRFSVHAEALVRRDIPTVTVVDLFRIPHLGRTAVLYKPLKGHALRQVARSGEFNEKLAGRAGELIARLHQKGIYFRSLHFGNIILGSDGSMGLIDISCMKLYPWPLFRGARVRNLEHLLRYDEDLKIIRDAGWDSFVRGYLNGVTKEKFRDGVERLFITMGAK